VHFLIFFQSEIKKYFALHPQKHATLSARSDDEIGVVSYVNCNFTKKIISKVYKIIE
jgi:hypothetical protein